MNTGKPIQTIPTTTPEPIPPTQPPTAPLLQWILLITVLLKTLEASAELLDQLEELTNSCNEILKTIVRIVRRK